ncbi:MAG: aldehyde dehydrogenase family protein [Verrucomicrobiales bacterium]
MQKRLPVLKTYKLFVGGKFPRSESGRCLEARAARGGASLANYCRASGKDFRDAVRAARKAQPGWSDASAFLKGQILYRAAEMLESRAEDLLREIARSTGATKAQARKETEACVDRLVYFAGWTDKYAQLFGAVNPVATSHFNFSVPEPTGVVVAICPDRPSLLPLVTLISTAILSGNSTVILASEKFPLPALSFAEVLATSDLPAGTVNILSGIRSELISPIAGHMDVNAVLDASGETEILRELEGGTATNLKRVADAHLSPAAWFGAAAEDPYRILDTVEIKTTWHPIGV